MTRKELANNLGLSKSQAEAVGLTTSKAIVAGAGSGKTTTLAASVIADLIIDQVDPKEICVATFTRSAANNLTDKIIDLANRFDYIVDLSQLTIGTIDSIQLNIVKNNSLKTGLSPSTRIGDDFETNILKERAFEKVKNDLALTNPDSIELLAEVFYGNLTFKQWAGALEQTDQLSLKSPSLPDLSIDDLITSLETIARKENKKPIEKFVAKATLQLKEGLVTESFPKYLKENYPEIGAQFEEAAGIKNSYLLDNYREALSSLFSGYKTYYQEFKNQEELVTYLDIEKATAELIDDLEEEDLFQMIYLDEAQDTSKTQQENFKRLLKEGGKIIIIGDIRQTIYSWRNASPESFSNWVDELGSVQLTDNYRSTKKIIDTVNLISKNLNSFHNYQNMTFPLEADEEKDVSLKILLNMKLTEEDQAPKGNAANDVEAPVIAQIVKDHILENNLALKDTCVIARTNGRVDLISKELVKIGLEAEAFFRDDLSIAKETRTPIALLRLFADPRDDQALIEILSGPLFLFGADQIEMLSLKRAEEETLLEVALIEDPDFPDLKEFSELFFELYKNKGQYRLVDRIQFLLNRFQYQAVIDAVDPTSTSVKNFQKLISLFSAAEEKFGPVAKSIFENIEADLFSKEEYSKANDLNEAIKVMTIHNSKGLEFPFVVYADFGYKKPHGGSDPILFDQGQFGIRVNKAADYNFQKISKEEKLRSIPEEDRCLYVALTRAERELLILARGKFHNNKFDFSEQITPFLNQVELDDFYGENLKKEIAVEKINFDLEAIPVSRSLEHDQDPIEKEKEISHLPFSSKKEKFYLDKISYTKLTDWQACSLRRHLEHDLRLKETIDLGGFSTGAREKGILIHTLLAEIDWNEPININNYQDEVKTFLETKTAKKIIKTKNKVETEKRFELQLAGQRIKGAIDLFFIEDETAFLVDWKTGKKDFDYSLQQKIYALAIFSSNKNIDKVHSIWQYQDSVDEKIFTDKDQLAKAVQEEIESIFNKEPEPVVLNLSEAEKSLVCLDCPGLLKICPISQLLKEETS
jgi:ATP-dependent exoDNAse (exonuclease V) beta subunit